MQKFWIIGDNMEKKSTFEENLKKLGTIVSELEKGDIPLEKAVELYGEGIALSSECRKQLDQAQLKITSDSDSSEVVQEENEKDGI